MTIYIAGFLQARSNEELRIVIDGAQKLLAEREANSRIGWPFDNDAILTPINDAALTFETCAPNWPGEDEFAEARLRDLLASAADYAKDPRIADAIRSQREAASRGEGSVTFAELKAEEREAESAK